MHGNTGEHIRFAVTFTNDISFSKNIFLILQREDVICAFYIENTKRNADELRK